MHQPIYRLHYLLRVYRPRLGLHFVEILVELAEGIRQLLLKLLLPYLQNLVLALQLRKLR